jgi:hypothetical protein
LWIKKGGRILDEINEIEGKNVSVQSHNENSKPSKLQVDIYVPLNACACEWSQFMNLIFSAITPYIKYIKHETKSLDSEEAREMGLFNKCVIIDGEKKYTTSYALKRDLPKILEEKGLL